jgi:hypothetical protein
MVNNLSTFLKTPNPLSPNCFSYILPQNCWYLPPSSLISGTPFALLSGMSILKYQKAFAGLSYALRLPASSVKFHPHEYVRAQKVSNSEQ